MFKKVKNLNSNEAKISIFNIQKKSKNIKPDILPIQNCVTISIRGRKNCQSPNEKDKTRWAELCKAPLSLSKLPRS